MKITDYVHLICQNHLNESSLVVDATCGNGFDTYFLASIVKNGKVLAYDIQEQAIKNTKERCKDFTNIDYHLESFTNINITNFDLVLFNLGYLPNGDKKITTMANDTILVVEKLINSFVKNPNLLIIITVYPGHDEGKKESDALQALVKALPSKDYLVTIIKPINQNDSPYLLTIERKHH